jgi:16S rRNA (cytidine1402-2'-O)-methyltransferase
MNPGTLYIVPTPIGNLEDITLRALRILKEVDLIAAEDTRHSRKLLTHFDIDTRLVSYYREKEAEKARGFVKLLEGGKDLALISDAGTPAISDPGAILVRAVQEAGLTVVPLPGASAVTSAFSASGILSAGYTFLGFPPAKSGARQKFLQKLVHHDLPVVLYESPRRIEALLEDSLKVLGERDAFFARELSKSHEELLSGTLSTLLTRVRKGVRGEFVLIICPAVPEEVSGESLEELLLWHRDNSDISVKDVSKKIAGELGISKSKVYQMALELWQNRPEEENP